MPKATFPPLFFFPNKYANCFVATMHVRVRIAVIKLTCSKFARIFNRGRTEVAGRRRLSQADCVAVLLKLHLAKFYRSCGNAVPVAVTVALTATETAAVAVAECKAESGPKAAAAAVAA